MPSIGRVMKQIKARISNESETSLADQRRARLKVKKCEHEIDKGRWKLLAVVS